MQQESGILLRVKTCIKPIIDVNGILYGDSGYSTLDVVRYLVSIGMDYIGMINSAWLRIDKPKKMEVVQLYVVGPSENNPYTRVIS